MGLPLLTACQAGPSIHLWVENDCMVEKLLFLGSGVGSQQCPEVEAQGRVPQQRGSVGHADGSMGG